MTGSFDHDREYPEELRDLTAGFRATPITHGMSGSRVLRLSGSGGESPVLKISAPGLLTGECERLAWLEGRLPVPVVLRYISTADADYLLTTCLPGLDASHRSHDSDISRLVDILAEGLLLLHSTSMEGCPFDHRLDPELARARGRMERGEVDEEDFDISRHGRKAVELYEELLATRPAGETPVLTHGDYSLPNIMIDRGGLGGFVDLGAAGIGDRYRDLALAARSLAFNFGAEHLSRLFEAYGLATPDMRRIAYYQMLDEFF